MFVKTGIKFFLKIFLKTTIHWIMLFTIFDNNKIEMQLNQPTWDTQLLSKQF